MSFTSSYTGAEIDTAISKAHDQVHGLGSADHTPTTLAQLNAKVSDATLVSIAGTETLTNKTIEGGVITQAKYEQAADVSLGTGTHTFSYAAGDMQQLTATGDITIAFSNFPVGKPASYVIDAVNWGAHTITHPAAMLFAAGVAPTYTISGTDRLQIVKDKDDVYTLHVYDQDIKVVA